MAIELRTYASGDTDYIAKLNANVAALEAAINALQAQAGAAGAGTALSASLFMRAVFNNADALVGPFSYKPTLAGTVATIAPGSMYLQAVQTVASSFIESPINFAGQTAGVYYIAVESSGIPALKSSEQPGIAYQVVWSGSVFIGPPVRIAPAFYDTTEAAASRISSAEASGSPPEPTEYETLDDRLEAMGLPIRKVGVSIDDLPGNKGAIQLDFAGTIIGWSVIADAPGDLTVDVYRAASYPPPTDPTIPNVSTDKISASAPIALSSSQSAATDETGVATWDTEIAQWDVIQFSVTTVSGITRATLYVRIQEVPVVTSP